MNIFILLVSGLLEKSSIYDEKCIFHFVNSLWKSMLPVFSEDLLIFVFYYWDLASKQDYEKVQANFIAPLESLFGIFYDYSYDLTICPTKVH